MDIRWRLEQKSHSKRRVIILDIKPSLQRGETLEYEIVETLAPRSVALLLNQLESRETENKLSLEVSWPTKKLRIMVQVPFEYSPTAVTADVWRGPSRISVKEVALALLRDLRWEIVKEEDNPKLSRFWLECDHPPQGFLYALKWVPPAETPTAAGIVVPKTGENMSLPTTTSITWLHISDLHYRDTQSYHIEVVEKALIRDLKRMITKGLLPDFVVFTGDLAFSGQADQYNWVEGFLDRLLSTCQITDRSRLFIVPGNHDIDRSRIDSITASGALKTLTSAEAVSEFLGPKGSGSRSAVFAKFGPYWEFFNRYFKDIARADHNDYFWTRRVRLGQHVIGLLGLNSAWMSGFNRMQTLKLSTRGVLIVGERQVWEALRKIDDEGGADLVVALLHHPLDNLTDAFDKQIVQSMLRRHCDFILHGHLHHPDVLSVSALDGETYLIPAGACYDSPSLPTGYNFVQLNLTTIETHGVKESKAVEGRAVLRRYSKRQEEWVPDIDATGEASVGEWPIVFSTRRLSG